MKLVHPDSFINAQVFISYIFQIWQVTIIVTNGYWRERLQSCFSLLGKPILASQRANTYYTYYQALYQAIVYDVYVLSSYRTKFR